MIMNVISVALSIVPAPDSTSRAPIQRISIATDVPIISVIGCESDATRVMRTIPDE
jgi:hypothetical protein